MNNIKILVLVFLIIIIISVVVYYIFKKEKFNAKHSLTQLPVQAHKQLPRQAHTHMTRQKHVQSHINRQKPVHSHVQSLTQMTRQNPRQIHRQSHVQSLTQMNRQNPRLTEKFKLGAPNSDPFNNVTVIGNMYYFNDAIENGYQSQNITSEELQELKDYLSSGPTTSDTVPSFSTDTNQEINTIGENEQSMASTKLDGHQTESTSAMDDAQSMAATGFFNALYGGFESGWTSSAVDQLALSVGLGIVEIGLAAEGLGFLDGAVASLGGLFGSKPIPPPSIEQITDAIQNALNEKDLQNSYTSYYNMITAFTDYLKDFKSDKTRFGSLCYLQDTTNSDINSCMLMQTNSTMHPLQPCQTHPCLPYPWIFDPSMAYNMVTSDTGTVENIRDYLYNDLNSSQLALLFTDNSSDSNATISAISNCGMQSLSASILIYPELIRIINLCTIYYRERCLIDNTFPNPWNSTYIGTHNGITPLSGKHYHNSILGKLEDNCTLLFSYLQNMYNTFYTSMGQTTHHDNVVGDQTYYWLTAWFDNTPFNDDPNWFVKMDKKYPNGIMAPGSLSTPLSFVTLSKGTDNMYTSLGENGWSNVLDFWWNGNQGSAYGVRNENDYSVWAPYFQNVIVYPLMVAFDEKMNSPFGPNGVLSILKKQAGITLLAGEKSWCPFGSFFNSINQPISNIPSYRLIFESQDYSEIKDGGATPCCNGNLYFRGYVDQYGRWNQCTSTVTDIAGTTNGIRVTWLQQLSGASGAMNDVPFENMVLQKYDVTDCINYIYNTGLSNAPFFIGNVGVTEANKIVILSGFTVAKLYYCVFERLNTSPWTDGAAASVNNQTYPGTTNYYQYGIDVIYNSSPSSSEIVYDPSGGYPFGSAKSSYADALQGLQNPTGTVGTDLLKNGTLNSPILYIPINSDGTYGVIDGSVFNNPGDIINYGDITCPTGYTHIMSTLLPGASPGTSDGTITPNSRKAFCYNPKTGQTSDLIYITSLVFDEQGYVYNESVSGCQPNNDNLYFRGYITGDGTWIQSKNDLYNQGFICATNFDGTHQTGIYCPRALKPPNIPSSVDWDNYKYYDVSSAIQFILQGDYDNVPVIMGIQTYSSTYIGPLQSIMYNLNDFTDIIPQGLYTRLNVINSPWTDGKEEENNQYPGTVNYYNYKISTTLESILSLTHSTPNISLVFDEQGYVYNESVSGCQPNNDNLYFRGYIRGDGTWIQSKNDLYNQGFICATNFNDTHQTGIYCPRALKPPNIPSWVDWNNYKYYDVSSAIQFILQGDFDNIPIIMGIQTYSSTYLGPLQSIMYDQNFNKYIIPQGLYTRLNVINSPWTDGIDEENNQYPGTVDFYNYKITSTLDSIISLINSTPNISLVFDSQGYVYNKSVSGCQPNNDNLYFRGYITGDGTWIQNKNDLYNQGFICATNFNGTHQTGIYCPMASKPDWVDYLDNNYKYYDVSSAMKFILKNFDTKITVIMGIQTYSSTYLGPLQSIMYNKNDFTNYIIAQGLYARLNDNPELSPWTDGKVEDNNQYPGTVDYYNYKITLTSDSILSFVKK